MIQVFMEDYSENSRGISFIMTPESTRRELAKKVYLQFIRLTYSLRIMFVLIVEKLLI